MAGYFFRYVAPKIAKNLAERRKTQDEVFKSIDEKGKGLSLQQRSNIKKSFSGKASKIYDKASKTRKGKMGGGMMGRRMGYASGTLKPIPEGNKGLPKLPKKVRNKMGFLKSGGKV